MTSDWPSVLAVLIAVIKPATSPLPMKKLAGTSRDSRFSILSRDRTGREAKRVTIATHRFLKKCFKVHITLNLLASPELREIIDANTAASNPRRHLRALNCAVCVFQDTNSTIHQRLSPQKPRAQLGRNGIRFGS